MQKGEYIECVRQYRLHIANVVMITYAQLIILFNTTLCKQVGTKMAGNTSMLNEHCLCTYGRTQQIVFHMFQEVLGMHKKQSSLLLHAIIQQYCFAKTNRCKLALIWHGIYKIWTRPGLPKKPVFTPWFYLSNYEYFYIRIDFCLLVLLIAS